MKTYEETINNLILSLKEDGELDTKKISDGHHTFGELYEHRILLFAVICNQNSDISWKSKKHFDDNDPMYEDSFIAGIATEQGDITYHIKNKYWDYFNVTEFDKANEYDGSNSNETLNRLLSFSRNKK